jgi:hypothetical protein
MTPTPRTQPDASLIYLLDSVGYVQAAMAQQVLVSGSHGGMSAARFVAPHKPALVVFNDAGVGRDQAGISGLAWLALQGVPAFAVSHATARIGEAQSTYDDGVVTHCNKLAAEAGASPGQRCAQAVQRVCPFAKLPLSKA